MPHGAAVHLPAFIHVPPGGAGGGEDGVRVGVGGRGHGGVEREAEVREPAEEGSLEERVAGEGIGAADEAEEADRVVEREREEAAGRGE